MNYQEAVPLLLNYLISVVFLLIDISLQNQMEKLYLFDGIFLLLAAVFALNHVWKILNWTKVDISPFFLWGLALKRFFIIPKGHPEYWYFQFGFLSGFYIESQKYRPTNLYISGSKITIEYLIIIGMIIYHSSSMIDESQGGGSVIRFLSPLIIATGISFQKFFRLHKQAKQPALEKQTSQTQNFQQLPMRGFDTQILQLNNPKRTIKKASAQSSLTHAPIWDELIARMVEEWFCRVDLCGRDFREALPKAQYNSSMEKFLSEKQLDVNELFRTIFVIASANNLSQSLQITQNENQELTLLEWIQQSMQGEMRRRGHSQFEEQPNSPVNDESRSRNACGPFLSGPQDISNIMSNNHENINSLGGSLQIPEKKQSLLQASLKKGEITQELQIQVHFYEYEQQNERQVTVHCIFRNIDKQVAMQQQMKERTESFTFFIRKLGKAIQELTKTVQESENKMRDLKQLRLSKAIPYQSISFQDHEFLKQKSEHFVKSGGDAHGRAEASSPKLKLLPNHQKITHSHEDKDDQKEVSEPPMKQSEYGMRQSEYGMKQSESTTQHALSHGHFCISSACTSAFILQNQCFNFLDIYNSNYNSFPITLDKINILDSITLVVDRFAHWKLKIEKKVQIHSPITNQIVNINPDIVTDRRRLKTVLFNILQNSVEAFPESNEQNKIKIILEEGLASSLKVSIVDNGPGLDDDKLTLKRFTEARMGLLAVQKILRIIGPNKPNLRKLQIFRSEQETKFTFHLAKEVHNVCDVSDFQFECLNVNRKDF